jgi:ferric iron reductase protein FhuF
MVVSKKFADDEICREIDQLTIGNYSPFANRLVDLLDPRPAVSAARLLDAPMRKNLEERFRRHLGAIDPRAVHSIWVKWYIDAILPPVLLADILLRKTIQVDLPGTDFVLSGDERVDAIKIGGARHSEFDDPFRRFEPIMFDHFAPLIDMWARRTDVTRRVLWSNVGNTFEAMLRKIEAVSGPTQRLSEAQLILDESDWRGKPNPIFNAVRYLSKNKQRVRRRRVCCLQYRLPGRRFCGACPIEERGIPR